MPLKTPKEYVESLRKIKPTVWMFGEKIENIIEHPSIKPVIGWLSLTYALASDPEYEDLFAVTSHLTGEKINRFLHIYQNVEDCLKRVKAIRTYAQKTCGCAVRCTATDSLNATWHITYDIDRKHGTNYHERLRKYMEYVQKNDLSVSGVTMDPKGDRSIPFPSKQKDPDAYLHVVEERKDGIVVRGAKLHQSGAVAVHEHIVLPCTVMQEADKDYAVTFAIPAGTKGIAYVMQCTYADCRRILDAEKGITMDHIGPFHETSVIIFDDVFVPWERVFQYKEYEYSAPIVNMMVDYHRMVSTGCKAGFCDVIVGAAATLADYIGLLRASHIREKLTEMVRLAESSYAGVLGAITLGSKTAAGVWWPNTLLCASSWYNVKMAVTEALKHLTDIAGGLIVTQPSELDYKCPELNKYLQKYLGARPDVPTEHRLRMLRLAETMMSGQVAALTMHAAGPPQVNIGAIRREIDFKKLMKIAKDLAGIEEKE